MWAVDWVAGVSGLVGVQGWLLMVAAVVARQGGAAAGSELG